jgi:RNA recognition motif-containing protein
MVTMFVRGLPSSTTEANFAQMFAAYGRVFEARIAKDLFNGQCKGFGQLRMEGHEARAAIAGLDGSLQDGAYIRVSLDDGKKRRGR